MSRLKTDEITAVSAGGDLSLDGLGTGGVSIASTLKMTKGGDIASASPLVIDTDGNYFDVSGTTNFSAMTVESGNFFMLQFDGALTITHGSGIELPGAANLTTATGDRLICYATAADTVEVMSVETEAAPSAGGFTLGTEQATTSGTSFNFTGIPAGTTMLVVLFEAVSLTATVEIDVQFGDSGGIETSGYISTSSRLAGTSTDESATDSFLINQASNTTLSVAYAFYLKDSSNNTWIGSFSGKGGTDHNFLGGGEKSLSGVLTQVTISGGTFNAGSINIMYQ